MADTEAAVVLPAVPSRRVLRGDWEPPDALLLAYAEEWSDSLVELLHAASGETRAFLLASAEDMRDEAFRTWREAYDVAAIPVDHDSPWIRDYGPIEITDEAGRPRWLDLTYYEDRPLDDALPIELSALADVDIESYPLATEGGALIGNGTGLCAMTTPSFRRALDYDTSGERARDFIDVLGCDALAVVPALSGEQTGHIDVIAQFLAPDLVAVAEPDRLQQPIVAEETDTAARTIVEAAESIGQPMRVVRLPLRMVGEAFFSYVNGTRVGGRVLLPSYWVVEEDVETVAYSRLQRALPTVKIEPIYADSMVAKGGAVHCLTLGIGVGRDKLAAAVQPGAPPPPTPDEPM